MMDKNGREIRTGDVVKITGAYFERENGLWFVERSPGDPSWLGSDYSLMKLCKNGRISTTKYNLCFWPLIVCTNSLMTRVSAHSWNKDHAEIEVIEFPNMDEIRKHFAGLSIESMESHLDYVRRFGDDYEPAKTAKEIAEHFMSVAERIGRKMDGN